MSKPGDFDILDELKKRLAPKPGTMQERAQVAAVEFVRGTTYTTGDWRDALVKFAAAEVAEAVRVEREECENIAGDVFVQYGQRPYRRACERILLAIRARSKT